MMRFLLLLLLASAYAKLDHNTIRNLLEDFLEDAMDERTKKLNDELANDVPKNFCQNKANGNYNHPTECNKFVSCSENYAYEMPCPKGLFFNEKNDRCDYKENVKCHQSSSGIIQGNTCYSTFGNQYGHIVTRQAGFITQLRLVHTSGSVTCDKRIPSYTSKWGCNGIGKYSGDKLATLVTNENNQVLFPDEKVLNSHGFYTVSGFNADSNFIVIKPDGPVWVRKGEQLNIWYGEDLKKVTVGDNAGQHCISVYATFLPQ